MILFCMRCVENHTFSPGEVEKIVYALQGLEADSNIEHHVVDAQNPLVCLTSALGMAEDLECYAEHVEACIKGRKKR